MVRELCGKKYAIQKYQGKHADEYTVTEVDEDGITNGSAQLFKRGLIQLSWREKDGKREGIVTLYENGVAKRKTTWKNLAKLTNGRTWDNAEVGIEEEEDQRGRSSSSEVFAEMVCGDNGNWYMVERDEKDTILYKGEGNDEMQKEGWGVQNDRSGNERYFGYYRRNRLVHVHQEFLKDTSGNFVMVEYRKDENDQNVSNSLKWYPIYVGGYEYDGKKEQYLRHGEGYQINVNLGICDFKGTWSHGKLSETVCEYVNGSTSGMKADPSIRECVMEMDEELPVCPGLNLSQIRGIEEFKIGNGLYNGNCSDLSKMKMKLSKFRRLKRIEIGYECFKHVREFVIDGLESLESVKIGGRCFTIYGNERDDGICRITNCPNLTKLKIGNCSFFDFKSLKLFNLNSIQSIKFGGHCFKYADFSLKGE